jgi:hypothetical protein
MTDDQAWEGHMAKMAMAQYHYATNFVLPANSPYTAQRVMSEEWDQKSAKRKTELRRPWLTGWRA